MKERTTTGGTCHICHKVLIYSFERHMEKCLSYPTAEEMVEMLKDPMMTMGAIRKMYNNAHGPRLGRILLAGDNDWTQEKLKARGHEVASLKNTGRKKRKTWTCIEGPRCQCGVMVPEDGDTCVFCKLELAGIRTHHDLERFT